MKKNTEYEAFENLARKLLSVPHRGVKARLDAEKETKKQKRKAKHALK